MHEIRPASSADLDPLAQLWHDGWREAHLAYVPTALTAKRTLNSFRRRLGDMIEHIRVAGPLGAPVGFCAIRENELNQLFVAPSARGTDLAARLLADGEDRLFAGGHARAYLLCIIENTRAVRFYERQGWVNMGTSHEEVQTEDAPFAFDMLRFEKDLSSLETRFFP